jgi:hypothetical protein
MAGPRSHHADSARRPSGDFISFLISEGDTLASAIKKRSENPPLRKDQKSENESMHNFQRNNKKHALHNKITG